MKKSNVSSLSKLVKKFSQEDVILQMEKEYRSVASVNIPLEKIDDNSYVNKVIFSKKTVNLLGKSIKEKGFFNPLVVRPKGDRYELILGRKRYFGAKNIDLKEVPAIIREVDDEEVLLMLLADVRDEREGNIIEMALICTALSKKFNYSQATLGKLSHQSRSQVTNIVRLLSLPEKVLKEVVLGELSYGHARALLGLEKFEIEEAVNTIHRNKLSVRETEALVKRYRYEDGDYEELISLITKSNARDVKIKPSSVSFEFDTVEEKETFIKEYLKQ
ncbi:MAG: ParB/RepB/Spo0J family partition protein [Bacilli bacterium]|nr:ParB/RepB/Spo0J family partition protein [Bacilli bacterium]